MQYINKSKKSKKVCTISLKKLSLAFFIFMMSSLLGFVNFNIVKAQEDTAITNSLGKEIFVKNGSLSSNLGDGTKENPYESIFNAIKKASDKDTISLTENITINGNEDLKIDKEITIDGKNKSITLRGKDIVLLQNVEFKNINLSFLTDGAIDLTSAKFGKIVVNDYQIILNNVSTLLSQNQQDERPVLIAGSKDGEAQSGDGAKIFIINANEQTKFKNIVLGNLSSEKNTKSYIEINQPASSELGISVSSYDTSEILDDVEIILNTNKITRIINSDKARFTSVKIGSNQRIYDIHLDKISKLILENNAELSMSDKSKIEELIIKESANLNISNVSEMIVGNINNEGLIKLDPNNKLIIKNEVLGNGKFELYFSRNLQNENNEFIIFEKSNPSPIDIEITNPSYELRKGDKSYSLIKKEELTEAKKFELSPLAKKIEVKDINNLSQDEIEKVKNEILQANKDKLSVINSIYIENDEKSVIIFFNDNSDLTLNLSDFVVKEGEAKNQENKTDTQEVQEDNIKQNQENKVNTNKEQENTNQENTELAKKEQNSNEIEKENTQITKPQELDKKDENSSFANSTNSLENSESSPIKTSVASVSNKGCSGGSSRGGSGGSGGGGSSRFSSGSGSLAQKANLNSSKINGKWFYDKDKNWYFLNTKGEKVTNSWIKHSDNHWYYLLSDGKMAVSQWIYDKQYSSWYYLNQMGQMLSNSWIKHSDNHWYYLLSDGKMATSRWIDAYYVNANGIWENH